MRGYKALYIMDPDINIVHYGYVSKNCVSWIPDANLMYHVHQAQIICIMDMEHNFFSMDTSLKYCLSLIPQP